VSECPIGWLDASLDEICETVRGITFPTSAKRFEASHGLIACLRTSNVQASVEWDDLWFVPERYVKNDSQLVLENDILISTANSYELVGKVSRVIRVNQPATLGAFISLLRALKGIDPGFLYYQVAADAAQRKIREMSSTTTNISNVSGTKLKTLRLSVAPFAEQTRIVEKLEELLSGLDAGVAELKAAQKKLVQYRQSLLKAAVEGTLTAPWREVQRKLNQPQETGAQLLQRILTERRARWEAKQLAKFAEQGKAPPKDWQKKYPEPVKPDVGELPGLPQGWVWTSLDALIADGPQNGVYLPGELYGRGTPILRIDDYQIGWHRPLVALNLVAASTSVIETYSLVCKDLVINRVNSMTHLGKSIQVSQELKGALFESNMMRIRFCGDVVVDFITYYLGSYVGRMRLISEAKWAVNQASINQQDVRRVPIPFPPQLEQIEIALLLAKLLQTTTDQSLACELGLKQAMAQRKNILKAAFSGQLVPQDPNDEPASALLERIRLERTESAIRPTKRSKKPQVSVTA
jgi:type I restriction enzyme, S subunit